MLKIVNQDVQNNLYQVNITPAFSGKNIYQVPGSVLSQWNFEVVIIAG